MEEQQVRTSFSYWSSESYAVEPKEEEPLEPKEEENE